MNEFDVIRRISGDLPDAPPEVLVPVGDDCAVLQLGGTTWAAAADMLVAGHHFEDWASPEDVGYKAVAVNVSDVAAMGAAPRFVLISGGAPDPETAFRCFQGVLEACEAFSVYPLGGDTTGAGSLTIDVSILGQFAHAPVLRSGARPGDLLAVTGELGASSAGFLALERGDPGPERLIRKHLRPEPRVQAGQAAARLGVRAMIDLSDGLASDVRHICEKSGVGCRIELESLPVAGDTREYLDSIGQKPESLAATGGEDYELLIAAPGAVLDCVATELDVPLSILGKVTEGEIAFTSGGGPVENLSGWDHFS
ncbi:MAG TPA: thiamine-phosphate kinase [Rubrobacteraceae bacterium]|nr:thiamine-phosphate kinase [Rubrobacteraceae bacterium]